MVEQPMSVAPVSSAAQLLEEVALRPPPLLAQYMQHWLAVDDGEGAEFLVCWYDALADLWWPPLSAAEYTPSEMIEAGFSYLGPADWATAEVLNAAFRGKDDIIQAQYAEIQELRRHLDLATEGVKHWMRLANAGSAISFSDGRGSKVDVGTEV